MKFLIDLDPVYLKALDVMATKLNKRSRQDMVAQILTETVDNNPELLAEVRRQYEYTTKAMIKVPELLPQIEVSRYAFLRNDDVEIEGEGSTPLEALADALGRPTSAEEFRKEYKGKRLI